MYYTPHFIRGITIGQTERLLNFISEVIGINAGKIKENTPPETIGETYILSFS